MDKTGLEGLHSNDSSPENVGAMNKTGSFYIAGLGASAGGLEALQQFFSSAEPNSGVAYVIVQHLSPDYKSMMVELIAKTTKMVVKRAENRMAVKPNEVYIIPPKTQMTIINGKLTLEPADYSKGLLLPIDVFFESLASDVGDKAIGVVLSGTGSDGTRGVRLIKEAGGIVMVQQEDTAKFNGMPGSAIGTGLADYILPPKQMPPALLNYIEHPYLAGSVREGKKQALVEEGSQLKRLTTLLMEKTGVDFSLYKPTTVLRRIERRMGIAQVTTLEEYLRYLNQSKTELRALYKDLLISVTKFFRDIEAFNALKEQVIPTLVEEAEEGKTLRVWVAGCATGEEAYSIAILFADYLESKGKKTNVKIFATDIEKDAMEYAARGMYPESIAADLPDSGLRRFFNKEGNSFNVNTRIRQMVVIASHNLISDPPFNRMDMVTCRNLLIYLKPPLQQRILKVFSFALYPRGYLFLGSSESIGEMTDLFDTINLKQKIFRHRGSVKPVLTEGLDMVPIQERLVQRGNELFPAARVHKTSGMDETVERVAFKVLNERIPACLVMDTSGLLLHTFGTPDRFLHTPQGKATLNVLDMLPREIALLVSSATSKVLRTKEPLIYRDVQFKVGDYSQMTNLTVEPYLDAEKEKMVILLFIEESGKVQTGKVVDSEDLDLDEKVTQRINSLELELQLSKENLQATIEELETSNEELQATNEELLASNEELQSTNEELQSVNEELYTVNAEYQGKINELAELNDDMSNLLSSTNIGKIFLDPDLRIRKFTPPVTGEIDLLPHDEGRLVTNFAHPFLREIADRAKAVMEEKKQFEKLIENEKGKWFLLRIVPYQTRENETSGVVAVMVDVTSFKESHLKARLEEPTEER